MKMLGRREREAPSSAMNAGGTAFRQGKMLWSLSQEQCFLSCSARRVLRHSRLMPGAVNPGAKSKQNFLYARFVLFLTQRATR
jgi:hypothetical protein